MPQSHKTFRSTNVTDFMSPLGFPLFCHKDIHDFF